MTHRTKLTEAWLHLNLSEHEPGIDGYVDISGFFASRDQAVKAAHQEKPGLSSFVFNALSPYLSTHSRLKQFLCENGVRSEDADDNAEKILFHLLTALRQKAQEVRDNPGD